MMPTPAEIAAAVADLKALEMKEVPEWERFAITDDLLRKIAIVALTAGAKARQQQATAAQAAH